MVRSHTWLFSVLGFVGGVETVAGPERAEPAGRHTGTTKAPHRVVGGLRAWIS